MIIFMQVPRTLHEMVHLQRIRPALEVLIIVFDMPIVEGALLEKVANENLRKVLNRLGR